jgi:hypothetical protein
MPVPTESTKLGSWVLGTGAFPYRIENPMPTNITRLGFWILGSSAFPTGRIPRLT